MRIFIVVAALFAQQFDPRQEVAEDSEQPDVIRQVTLHPVLTDLAMCAEHAAGEISFPGDALGQDCIVMGGMKDRGFISPFASDGKTNEDWYGWGRPVLAPLSGRVSRVTINDVTNRPGKVGKPPATGIVIRDDENLFVVIAHLGKIVVEEGDRVEAGQTIGTVGNNGFGRAPHVHIGAWDDRGAYQIRWDLKALAKVRRD